MCTVYTHVWATERRIKVSLREEVEVSFFPTWILQGPLELCTDTKLRYPIDQLMSTLTYIRVRVLVADVHLLSFI